MTAFGILAALIVIPLLAAAAVVAMPARQAKWVALLGTLAALVAGLSSSLQYPWEFSADPQLTSEIEWMPALGLRFSLGADGVSFALILLTLLLGPVCVACSFTAITDRVKTYYGWLLVLQAAMTGVFAAQDLILFYICFEFTLIPMFILISLYGSTNRRAAAIKFFLYTFTGSIIALAGFVFLAYTHSRANAGVWNYDIASLTRTASGLPLETQKWVLFALLLGFAVKIPLFPFHTWLPLAHTEAPTAGSVILAGVLLKLGTYGLFRFALPMAPEAVVHFAPFLAGLCIVGILYGGLICWVQQDVKKLVAYSSVAHLGFCILGLLALNNTGVRGSVLYMINHGLSTGGLFLLIGMMYERYHTRDMREIGGLAAKMPVWATFMVFFTMASVGLPGLNGFVSEFMCLLGAFQASPTWGTGVCTITQDATPGATVGGQLGPIYAAIAGVGMIVAAMYLLMMVGKVVWGPLKEPHGHGHDHGHGRGSHDHAGHLPTDLGLREILVLLPMAAGCVWLGVYPKPALEAINPSSEALVSHMTKAAVRYAESHPERMHPSWAPKAEGSSSGVQPGTGVNPRMMREAEPTPAEPTPDEAVPAANEPKEPGR
jgi:NADH-quinone oxidoreductase subunit M